MVRAQIAAAMTLLACACAGDDARRYELDGLTVIADFDDPICAGTFTYFERRLRWLEHETGLPRDPAGLTYRWFLDAAAIEAECDFSLGGCTKGRTFYGNIIAYGHELVHAHLARLGHPRIWLTEGMAVMLQDEHAGAPQPLFTPSLMMQIDEALELDYAAAGAFTTYLRDRYGMALLLDYYETSAGSDVETALKLFEDVFGDGFEDVEADYLDRGLPETSGSPDCDGPEVAWTGAVWEHAFDLSCEAPSSVGPERSDGDAEMRTYLWTTVTMTVPPGWISLELDSPGPAWITLTECDGNEVVYVDAEHPHTDANLAGGRYQVFADAFIADEPTPRVTARRLAAAPTSATRVSPPGLLSHDRPRERRCSHG